MGVIQIIVIIVVVGVLLWLANTYAPMDPKIKQVLNAVVVIALVLWLLVILLRTFGVGMGPIIG